MTVVGVVIPTHRADGWLDEAVESVLASRGVEVRVVVVANGMAEFPHRPWLDDRRIRLIHKIEPLGPTRAMILGVQNCATEFVARLDADDRMLPERLAAQVARLDAQPAAPMVGTATRRISADGAPAGSIRMPVGDDVRHHLILSNTVPHSSVMMRRASLESIGGYNAALEQMEDYDVILRLAQRGPIPVLADELTEYRLHDAQVSRGAKPRGAHIDLITRERARLGRALGMNAFAIGGRNVVWRAAQYARYYRVTRPGHEY